MTEFSLIDTRGELDESAHRIRVAVVHDTGRVVARAGDPETLVFWRSAAKPFQLWPLVAGGGIERFGLEPKHLALACGSHSAEPMHRAVATDWLERIGLPESALTCGGHPSLSPKVAEAMIREGVATTPIWSNCSGKHAAMLGLAMLHGWPIEGYASTGHPVQDAIANSISLWSGVGVDRLAWGVDGCTAAAVATPLTALALAWSRLGSTDDPAMVAIREAMIAHPVLVAGTDRFDTVLMSSWQGRILAKVGAEGVYAAAIPELRLGVALKVEDGDMRVAAQALVSVLHALLGHVAPEGEWPWQPLARWHEPEILNTRGDVVGQTITRGLLRFP
ncbi:MAG: asparaginase [Gemmatimonadota bacterium]